MVRYREKKTKSESKRHDQRSKRLVSDLEKTLLVGGKT